MKIKKIKYWKQDMGITRPYAVTYVLHDKIENMFVEVHLSDGTVGYGAGSASEHVTGELMADDAGSVEDLLGATLIDREIGETRALVAELRVKLLDRPALLAAVDIALHDALCKKLGVSLGHYLGICHREMPTSITIGLKNVEETLEEGREYKERNFKVIKLKIGASKEEDIARTLKLRETVGSDMVIRVDANQGYSVSEFEDYVQKTAAANVEFYEQPMKPSMNQEMLQFDSSISEICAADESLHNSKNALELVRMGRPFGIFNIKIMKAGGFTEGLRIADIAHATGISLMWGCMDESALSISASLNAAFSSPATKYIDLDGSLDLGADPAIGGFKLVDGVMYPLLDQLGLGVTF